MNETTSVVKWIYITTMISMLIKSYEESDFVYVGWGHLLVGLGGILFLIHAHIVKSDEEYHKKKESDSDGND